MKINNPLLTSCVFLAGLGMLPLSQAHAASAQYVDQHFLAENSFTESVKEGYQDLKANVKGAVNDMTGDERTDAQKFRAQREEDLKDYRKDVQDAREDYMEKRQDAQKTYLKNHSQLPVTEDFRKDMDVNRVNNVINNQ